ncbi:HU family DNA-binding protein [Nonomuraea angiospora]
MNKGQLTAAVNEIIQDRKTSELAVNAVLAVIRNTLASGENIGIPKFGSFKVVNKPAREARNPSTGEQIHVPAKRVVKFHMGSDLEAAVNGSKA